MEFGYEHIAWVFAIVGAVLFVRYVVKKVREDGGSGGSRDNKNKRHQ